MLLISPTLAQTLGLEEALLLQLLIEMQQLQGTSNIIFREEQRAKLLPFWSQTQFKLVLERLQAQGVATVDGNGPWSIQVDMPTANEEQSIANTTAPTDIIDEPRPQAEAVPVYTMNDARRRNQYDDDLAYLKNDSSIKKGIRAKKTKMHSDWEPTSDFPNLLNFHDIPLPFALSELAKFRQYYLATDRTEISWDVRFLNWVQRSWHDSLNAKGRHDKQNNTTGEPADSSRTKRTQVREALRNIKDTNW